MLMTNRESFKKTRSFFASGARLLTLLGMSCKKTSRVSVVGLLGLSALFGGKGMRARANLLEGHPAYSSSIASN